MSIKTDSVRDNLKPAGFRPEKAHLVLSTVAINMISLALPIMTLQVYDRILPNPDSGTLPILVAGVCIAIVLETCLRLARTYMIGWSGAVYEHGMAVAGLDHVLHADVSKLRRQNVGEYLHRMAAIGKLKDFHNGYALVTLVELAFVPVFLGVIFYIAHLLTIVPLAVLALFLVISLVQGRRMRAAIRQRDKEDDARYDFLIEGLKGVHTVKAFALEKLFSRRYDALQEKSAIASYHTAETAAEAFNTGTVLSHFMTAAVIAAGAAFVLNGQATTGALIASIQLSGRMMQSVQRVLVLWAKYQDFALAQEKVRGIFNIPLGKTEFHTDIPAAEGRLSIRNLSFSYGEEPLLRDITLELGRGDVISIGGCGGCGKTTLLELIAGLYPAGKGAIEVDGLDVCAYPPRDLARHVAYMPAEAAVFRGTIRDNMTRFGEIPEADVREIAALLNIDSDVAKLPAGFDTFLQAGGTGAVPPGLRQRIAMTRILATRPKIILFDEADRGLDHEGYNTVFSLLGRLGRKTAMILVSEDANITSLAQRHYTLRNGLLEEDIPPQTSAVTILEKRT